MNTNYSAEFKIGFQCSENITNSRAKLLDDVRIVMSDGKSIERVPSYIWVYG